MATVTRKRRRRNKSAAIRVCLEQNPGLGPTEIARLLAERKVKVTVTHVSNVKSRLASGEAVGTRGLGKITPSETEAAKPVRNPAAANGDSVSLSALVEAKRMVEKCGSIEAARVALETLGKLA